MDKERTSTEQEQAKNGVLESNTQSEGESPPSSVSESNNRAYVDKTDSKTEPQETQGERVVVMEQQIDTGESVSVEILSGLLKQHKSVYRYITMGSSHKLIRSTLPLHQLPTRSIGLQT